MKIIDDVKLIVIHCSDTPNDQNISAIDIHKMHLGFGWDGIGYHKIICRDGKIEVGRPEYWIGAHTKGKNNESLGVCLIGKSNFTDAQYNALEKVLKEWIQKYPQAEIKGHSQAIETKKTCPNFDVEEWCKSKGLVI